MDLKDIPREEKSQANNDEHEKTENATDSIPISEENELLSSDMRRELLRKEWEKEEEALRDKSNIHYQDILFNGNIFCLMCLVVLYVTYSTINLLHLHYFYYKRKHDSYFIKEPHIYICS